MKTIVAGSRSIKDQSIIDKAIANSGITITELVCGMADGVDSLGYNWAKLRAIPIKEFPPKYDDYEPVHKTRAPLDRNVAMAEYAEALILVWDGKSTGSMHMFRHAAKRNLRIYLEKL